MFMTFVKILRVKAFQKKYLTLKLLLTHLTFDLVSPVGIEGMLYPLL